MTATQRDRRARRALGLALLSLSSLWLVGPRVAAAPQEAWYADHTWGPYAQLFGRLHFALVHFPIGLLIAAGVVELVRRGRGPRPSSATMVCLGLGWIGAGLAAYSGWTYAAIERHGHDPGGLLYWHRWGGVAVAVAAFVTWCVGFLGRGEGRGWARTLFGLLLLVTTIGTGIVGHFGGSLVYGEDYLSEPFDEAEKARRLERFAPEHATDEPAGLRTEQPGATDPQADLDEALDGEPREGGPAARGEASPVEPEDGELAVGLTGGGPADQEPLLDPEVAAATIGDFLAGDADAPAPAVEATGARDEAALYEEVALVFELTCYHCHGQRKGKGELRLHETERLFERDPSEWVVVPGHPEKSELLRRLSLSADDEDVMPSDGDPLLPEDVELVRAWIAAMDPAAHGLPADGGTAGAAVLGDWSVAVIPPAGAAPTDAGDAAGASDTGAGGDVDAGSDADGSSDAQTDGASDAAAASTSAASAAAADAALAALRERGAVATRLAEDAPDADVVLGLLRDDVTDADLALLHGLEPALVSLDLSRTAVTDAGLAALAGFPRLRRLRLDHTGVGDAGLAHLRELAQLEYLNLVGTAVTDEGLGELAGLDALRRLYLWQAPVTDAGVDALRAALPELEVVRDVELPGPPPPLEVVEGDVTFEADVAPILARSCVECHGAEEPAAGVRLDTFDAVFAGSWAEWSVKPGAPDQSRLLLAVQREPGTKGAMPKKGDPLSTDEVAVLSSWIAGLREVEAQPPAEEPADTGGDE